MGSSVTKVRAKYYRELRRAAKLLVELSEQEVRMQHILQQFKEVCQEPHEELEKLLQEWPTLAHSSRLERAKKLSTEGL